MTGKFTPLKQQHDVDIFLEMEINEDENGIT